MFTMPMFEELEGIYGKNYRGLRGSCDEKGQVLEFVREIYVGGRGFGNFANEIAVAKMMMKDAGYTDSHIYFHEPNMTIQITAWRDETDEEQEKRLALQNGARTLIDEDRVYAYPLRTDEIRDLAGLHSGLADELQLLEKEILSVIGAARIEDLSVWIKLQQEIALIFHNEREQLNHKCLILTPFTTWMPWKD